MNCTKFQVNRVAATSSHLTESPRMDGCDLNLAAITQRQTDKHTNENVAAKNGRK